MNEEQLLQNYVSARNRVDAEKTILKEAEAQLEEAESRIVEFLESSNKKDTGLYPGIGKLSITVPQVFASIKEENKSAGFEYLKQMNRADLIKETVNAQSLRSFIKEVMESGKSIPDCISYYLKPSVKFTRS